MRVLGGDRYTPHKKPQEAFLAVLHLSTCLTMIVRIERTTRGHSTLKIRCPNPKAKRKYPYVKNSCKGLNTMTQLIARNKPDQLPLSQKKLPGLQQRKPNQVAHILRIEKLWENYAWNPTDENLHRLLSSVKFTIYRKAEAWHNRWKNKRLCKDDFLSAYYETAWKLCESYSHYQEFYFYETLCLAINRRGIDLTRKLLRKQTDFEVAAIPLLDETADYLPDKRINIENDVVINDLTGRILKDESLTMKERQLLQVIYDNPDASNREIASIAGLNHHYSVTRSLRRIKQKINHFYL